ncbi:MAG: His/Gly/Thr/Pro-type tRNA ligase C-terminal domain-containing protein, partial [Acidobacteriota bacterium]
ANKDDFHLRGVNVARDIKVDKWAELRTVVSGEGCPNCDGTLRVDKAIEIGHIFKLGTKYSESMGARVLTAEGKEVPIVMGSYGIGVGRIMGAAVELYNDNDGISWPVSIAPFEVIVTPANYNDGAQREAAEELYHELTTAGLDVLLDERDERPGVKFKDADLIGIPFRVTIGKKLKEGKVEFFTRRTKQSQDIEVDNITNEIKKLIVAAK